MSVGEVATRPVFTSEPDEEIHEALETMASTRFIGCRSWTVRVCLRAFFRWMTSSRMAIINKWEELLRAVLRRNNSVPEEDARPKFADGSHEGSGRLG